MKPELAQIGLDVAAALSQGARDYQEDAVATAFAQGAGRGFALLSDGMGGHACGDVASRLIVSEMFATLTVRSVDAGFAEAEIPSLLRYAVDRANDSLRAYGRVDPASSGMGGTAIGAVIEGQHLYWISVGDSLLFLFRDGRLQRLNEDHSMAPHIDLMVTEGLIDAEAARSHPQRNCLTSALFGAEIEAVDCPATPLRLMPQDTLILASDGLQTLPEAQIAAMLTAAPDRDCRGLVRDLAVAVADMDDPDQDNLSIVAIRVQAAAGESRPVIAVPPPAGGAFARAFAPVRQLVARG